MIPDMNLTLKEDSHELEQSIRIRVVFFSKKMLALEAKNGNNVIVEYRTFPYAVP